MEAGKALYGLAGAFVAALLLAKNHCGERWGRRPLALSDAVVLVGGMAFIAVAILVCARNVWQPLPWDYPIFYTVARQILGGREVYIPDFYSVVLKDVPAVASIPEDVHHIARFVYPPPSALLMVPFGVFSYPASLTAHYIVQALFLIATSVSLHRVVSVGKGWRGITEVLILILAFRPVENGLAIGQVVFGALLGLAVAFQTIEAHPAIAGAALGIGCLYKQLLLGVASVSVYLGKMRTLIALVLTTVSAGLASMVVLGAGVFRDYVTYGQSVIPAASSCGGNYSLFGMLCDNMELTGRNIKMTEALQFPEFAVPAAIVSLATLILCLRTLPSPAAMHLKLALALAFSLVVFPWVGYYSVALILPALFVLYSHRAILPISSWMIIAFFAIQYALVVIPVLGGFVVSLSTWFMVAAMLLFAGPDMRSVSGKSPPPPWLDRRLTESRNCRHEA